MRSPIDLAFTLLKTGEDPNQVLVKLALRKALLGCESVLDVGCGASMTMRHLDVPHPVGAEGYLPSVEKARANNTPHELVLCNVSELAGRFQPGQFDACVALDVIEHLKKPDGLKLMEDMERIAKKRVVFFTPIFRAGSRRKWRNMAMKSSVCSRPKNGAANIICSKKSPPHFGEWPRWQPNACGASGIPPQPRPFFA